MKSKRINSKINSYYDYNIIVLGNGFDLFYNVRMKHGNKSYGTTFADYSKFIKSKSKYKKWYEFCTSFLEITELDEWNKIESKIQALFHFTNDSGKHSKIDFISRYLEDIIAQKEESFNDFFNPDEIECDEKKMSKIHFMDNDIIISFNYTTRQLFNKIFGKKFHSQNLIMMHGELHEKVLIGGNISDVNIPKHKKNTCKFSVLKDVKIDNFIYSALTKNVQKQLQRLDDFLNEHELKHPENLYFLGLSISEVDIPYYHYLFSLFKDGVNFRYSLKKQKKLTKLKQETVYNFHRLITIPHLKLRPVVDSLDFIIKELHDD